MHNILVVTQLTVSILLIGLILLQAKGTGLGGSAGEFYSSKRGIEKSVFIITIILAVLFGAISITTLWFYG